MRKKIICITNFKLEGKSLENIHLVNKEIILNNIGIEDEPEITFFNLPHHNIEAVVGEIKKEKPNLIFMVFCPKEDIIKVDQSTKDIKLMTISPRGIEGVTNFQKLENAAIYYADRLKFN